MKKPNIFKIKPILPSNVELYKKNDSLLIKSGSNLLSIQNFYSLNSSAEMASHCKFLFNDIVGVTARYFVSLKFVGIGYRVQEIKGSTIKMRLGFSHVVSVSTPSEIEVYNPKKNTLILTGTNKAKLMSFAYFVRSLKIPDCYKAKGILLKNEKILLKEGKK